MRLLPEATLWPPRISGASPAEVRYHLKGVDASAITSRDVVSSAQSGWRSGEVVPPPRLERGTSRSTI